MNFSYNPLLVILSVLVAVQASYVGLSLATHIAGAFAQNRRLLIVGSAISLAVGIWSMHFIGMLAVKTTSSLDYDVLPTLISFLVCVLVTGAAVYLACMRGGRMLVVAASIMGLGIAAMHYIGMIAVHSGAHMMHDPVYIVASIVIAIAASGLALWLAFAAQKRPPLLVCAAVLGCAISGMHYTAMIGTTFHGLGETSGAAGSVLSGDLLAVIVSIVAFSVSGMFMLTLIPSDTADMRDFAASGRPQSGAFTLLSGKRQSARFEDHIDGSVVAQNMAGLPDAHIRANVHVIADPLAQPASVGAQVPFRTVPQAEITLPFEKQGQRFHIEVGEILSVHANAHYTYLFNGREDLFCPLSITEIVARLPRERFFRTHRSYVVNLACILQLRKAADAGIAELNAPLRRTVPVSRSRFAPLRQELAAFQAANAAIMQPEIRQ